MTRARGTNTAAWSMIALTAVEALAVAALALVGASTSRQEERSRRTNRLLVRELLLTDPALSAGTSYCRHPSQADLFAPFGDHPSAIEHFPTGSIMAPPSVATPLIGGEPGP